MELEVKDNKDEAIALLKAQVQAMCDCGASFAGKETIDIDEFMDKAGPIIANGSSVLNQVDYLLS